MWGKPYESIEGLLGKGKLVIKLLIITLTKKNYEVRERLRFEVLL